MLRCQGFWSFSRALCGKFPTKNYLNLLENSVACHCCRNEKLILNNISPKELYASLEFISFSLCGFSVFTILLFPEQAVRRLKWVQGGAADGGGGEWWFPTELQTLRTPVFCVLNTMYSVEVILTQMHVEKHCDLCARNKKIYFCRWMNEEEWVVKKCHFIHTFNFSNKW